MFVFWVSEKMSKQSWNMTDEKWSKELSHPGSSIHMWKESSERMASQIILAFVTYERVIVREKRERDGETAWMSINTDTK